MRTSNVADRAQLSIYMKYPLKTGRYSRYVRNLKLQYGMNAENGGVEAAKNHKI